MVCANDIRILIIVQGGIEGHDHEYALDEGHLFERGRPVLVCGNTAAMLGEGDVSWLSPYFQAMPWPSLCLRDTLHAYVQATAASAYVFIEAVLCVLDFCPCLLLGLALGALSIDILAIHILLL